jgi:hypothetical protein
MTGLPAAGKSAAERKILECLRARQQPALQRPDLIHDYIRTRFCRVYGPRYWLRRPVTLRYRAHVWLKHLRDRRSSGVGLGKLHGPCGFAGYLYSEDSLLYSHYLNRGDGVSPLRSVYVASEGLVNHAAALRTWCGPALEPLCGRWLLDHPDAPLVVLHLQAPPEEAFERFWKRGVLTTWPRCTRSLEGARSAFSRFQRAIEESLDEALRAGGRVVTLDASGSPDQTASKLADLLDTLL